MASVLHEIAVDCRDAEAQAAWWSRVLGWPAVHDESGFWWISSDGTEDATLALSFIPVPEGKTVKNRIHLDLNPSGCEQAEELERLLSLGARHKDIGQGPDVSWVVLEDPEGGPTRKLVAGDILLFPHRSAYALHDGSDAAAAPARQRPRSTSFSMRMRGREIASI